MGLLFDRNAAVTFGTAGDHIRWHYSNSWLQPATIDEVPFDVTVSGIRIAFDIKKNTEVNTNKAKVILYNLKEDHRALLQKGQNQVVVLEAGYQKDLQQLFVGDIKRSTSFKSGPDWITEIIAADGDKGLKDAFINKTFGPGIDYDTIVEDMIKTMTDTGRLVKGAFDSIKTFLKSQRTQHGITLSGKTKEELVKILKSFNYELSIQDGEIQITDPDATVDPVAFKFSPQTGLIGSPRRREGGIELKSLIVSPKIVPGSVINVESRYITGFFKAKNVNYKGDTHDNPWYLNIEAEELN